MATQTMRKRPRMKKVDPIAVLKQQTWLSNKAKQQSLIGGKWVYYGIVIENPNKRKTLEEVGARIVDDVVIL